MPCQTSAVNTSLREYSGVGGGFCYNSPDAETFTTSVARASQVFSILVLVVLGMLGNVLMVYAVLATRLRDATLSASSLLLINLAVADLMVSVSRGREIGYFRSRCLLVPYLPWLPVCLSFSSTCCHLSSRVYPVVWIFPLSLLF